MIAGFAPQLLVNLVSPTVKGILYNQASVSATLSAK